MLGRRKRGYDRRIKWSLIWIGAEVNVGAFKLKLEGVTQGKRVSRKLAHWVLSTMVQSADVVR